MPRHIILTCVTASQKEGNPDTLSQFEAKKPSSRGPFSAPHCCRVPNSDQEIHRRNYMKLNSLPSHNFSAILPGNSVTRIVVTNGILNFLNIYNTLLVCWLVLTWFPNSPPAIVSPLSEVDTLKRYKFSLAFVNSTEEDYVIKKYFQSLVAGTIPVVVGAPNIQDFAPSPGAVLHIKELEDIASVSKMMKYLAEHPDAYNQSLGWKFEGPSDSFKALVDMAAVHSSCCLCIYVATMIREIK